MSIKQKKRWLGFLLSGLILFTNFALPTTAETSSLNGVKDMAIDVESSVTSAPVSSTTSPEKETIDNDTNLYSKTKRNEDGTYTLEVFDVPVKYVDKGGLIKTKSLDLVESTVGYSTRQSDINCVFPKQLSAGISLTYGDTVVTMIPDIAQNIVKTQHKDGIVSYLTDNKTLYQYSLTYMGYKEDIIVPDYTGQTEYHFTYYTNGLHMAVVEGELVLTDRDGNIVAGFSEVIVFTADDLNNTFGEYRCETIKANEEYRVTIVLDADYLRDEKTAYPIVIDPSLEINHSNYGSSAIEDATINSTAGTSPNGTTIFVGKRSTKGIARLLVKFPQYDFSRIGHPNQIISAKYVMRDLMCYSTQLPVEAHVFKSTWAESNVTWSSINSDNYVSTIMDTQTVFYRNGNYISTGSSYSNSYAFDITPAVKGWMRGTYNQQAGIIFKTTNAIETGDTNISVCFASFERSSNKPRLIVNYYDFCYILNVQTECCIDIEGPSISSSAIIQEWEFNASVQSRWMIINDENNPGYVQIKSVLSNKYIGVDPNDTSVVRQYNQLSDYSLWRIGEGETENDGDVVFYNKALEASNQVLAVSPESTGNSSDLTMQVYVPGGQYSGEWSLINCYDIRCIGIQDVAHEMCDHTRTFYPLCNDMSAQNYTTYEILQQTSVAKMLGMLATSRIFVINTHGNQNSVQVYQDDLELQTINELPDNALAHLDLVLYVACETAKGGAGADNLVNATASKGANLVIGFQESIYCSESDIWVPAFFNALSEGRTVEEAISDAHLEVATNWTLDDLDNTKSDHELTSIGFVPPTQSIYYVGDGQTILRNW